MSEIFPDLSINPVLNANAEELGVSPSKYLKVFLHDPDGSEIYEELLKCFFNEISFTAGDPYQTAYKEGMRNAIQFIRWKLELGQKSEESDAISSS